MTDLQNLVNQLVSAAKAAGVELADLAPLLADAWASDSPPVWDANGMSRPDELGLVRFQELEDLKAHYASGGQQAAADAIRHRFACVPGLRLCAADSAGANSVKSAVSTAAFYEGMGLPGGWNFFPSVPTSDPLGPKFVVDRTHPVEDAYSIPKNQDTPQKCVDYIKAIAKRFE